MKNKILILSGDPNSINSEVIYKSFKKIKLSVRKKIYLITNYNLIKKQLNKLKYKMKFINVKDINENVNSNKIKIVNVDIKFKNPFKISKNISSKFIYSSLNLAHKYALNHNVSGIINCPINKNLLVSSKTGVTEYLASKCSVKDNSEVMLIRNKNLSVAPVTTHVDIKNVSKGITANKIVKKIMTIQKWYKNKNKKKPIIGILGLNPHNAEYRKLSEEKKIIIPVVKKLKKIGIKIKGPLVADTLFIEDFKNYDVIVGMFHDQVLAPFKSIFKYDAINITLGLNYLRVSPDHGVAIDLIGKNKANPQSLIECINFLNKS